MSYDSIFRPGLFDGQTIIVTGGGSGIGRCTAHELAALGAHVVLVGRKAEKLEKTASEIVEDGGSVSWHACDIREEEAVKTLVANILAERGTIHHLVNNAGGQYPSPLASISQKGFETVLRTNLVGGFLVAREVFNQSMSKTGGSIVNMLADMWAACPAWVTPAPHARHGEFHQDRRRRVGPCRRAGQRGGAGLDRVQRHGYLRRRVQGGDPDPARARAAQAHRQRVGSRRRHRLPALPGAAFVSGNTIRTTAPPARAAAPSRCSRASRDRAARTTASTAPTCPTY